MPKDRENNHYSEEAQEILGRIPSWIIRWGVTVIFCLFAGIILGCCIIRYPERVKGTVIITTGNSPVDVLAKSAGNIERISVSNGELVKEGDVLGVIYTGADYRDILAVDTCLAIIACRPLEESVFNEKLYMKYYMGTLQGQWSSFVSLCRQYRECMMRGVMRKRMMLVREQIDKQKEYYSQMQVRVSAMMEDLRYEKKNFMRDSLLFDMDVVSEQVFDESARRLLQVHNSISSFRMQMTSMELSIIQLEQQLVELSIKEEDETLAYEQEIHTYMERLFAEMRNWKLTYLLTAPISGHVSFVRKWDEGQFMNTGDHYLTVVPDDAQSVIGIVKIPQASFGRVNVGQRVNVKLDGYPYMEYGMLVGTIASLSSVPEESGSGLIGAQYTARILFPNGMVSTYGKELRMIQKMEGTAEVITEEKRLIMRFLDPIVTLFKNGV